MKKTINVENKRKAISLVDDIIYSKTSNDNGDSVNLYMSMLIQNVNVERKIIVSEKLDTQKQPVILCIPGGGFTHCARNRILPELQFLAEEGYVIATIDYRLSSSAKFPAQIEDVYTAIKYLKDHSNQYNIDEENIGILGRSAGGCLSLMAGMNMTLDNLGCKYGEEILNIKAACSMYGITDLPLWMEYEIKNQYFSNAKFSMETLVGKYVGGTESTILEYASKASPIQYINIDMANILILHGDNDPIVPLQQSEKFYNKMKKMGMDEKIDFYTVSNAGHGSKEFFQNEIKSIMIDYFKKQLKVGGKNNE
ncbi:prolyl oligopeptidase family serine peptidase [Breznakia pachnodae]|uniref:Acetyl esterase/lipase n=1 Tax=Breznakia pachnodae TaxID=265178 RepID=A0ABU0E0R9_9FIRM|nr:prolyl oligopeptidase family serine peptidase [Breznakia pachnodae]MDQ0360460.1 acetyl esterase/lipase [Breznakia pachnodae]